MTHSKRRVGLIVPSSNVTMEIEVPAVLRDGKGGDEISFHSSRMPMRQVSAAELLSMDAEAIRCVNELVDARCDVLAYACLVAVMVQGPGAHRKVEEKLGQEATDRGQPIPIVSSAGAVVSVLQELGARRVAMVTPYMPELTSVVVSYLEAEGVEVTSVRSLSVADNYEVGCIAPSTILDAVGTLDLDGVDALVLSACVQMPSLSLVQRVRGEYKIPVVTAATATAWAVQKTFGSTLGQFSLPWRPLP
jgi:maleate isomerase